MTRLIVTVTLLLTLTTTPASADPDPRVEAKAHFLRGQEHQRAGRYDEAIAAYQAAYAAAPMPGFLFNLGQVYRLKGDKRHAVEYYRKYLAAEPNSGPSVEAQQHIQSLSADLVAEEEAARAARAEAEAEVTKPDPGPAGVATAGDGNDDEAEEDDDPIVIRRHTRPHDGRLAIRARTDIDARGRGALGAAGVAVRLNRALDVELSALLGAPMGGYLGATYAMGHGTWRPIVSAGMPVLRLDGTTAVGAQAAAGVRWQPTRRTALFGTAGAIWLANAPSTYEALAWGPSLGGQLTF
jgi:hypothetical protein